MNDRTAINPTAEKANVLRKRYASLTEKISRGQMAQSQLRFLGVPESDRRRVKLARDLAWLDDAKCLISEQLQTWGRLDGS